jgi:serine/threonine protein phosphatase 1
MRTLVIGDIHGGLRALQQVLERCEYNTSNDQLIFLGDYVDGWSQSAEVIEELIQIRDNTTITPIFLRGNHDKWCEDWLRLGVIHPYWLTNGGQTTKDSYLTTGLLREESHRKFFRELHNYYVDDQNRAFVHGGFVSRKGVGYDPYPADYYWDRDMWELAVMLHNKPSEGTSKSRRFEKHKEVYIGHTATKQWKVKLHLPESKFQKVGEGIHVPMNRCNVWNLDTGGGWAGKISIMDIDTKQFWQSDFVYELYPEEKGRN